MSSAALSPGAAMVANRLRKNQRRVQAWLQREGIHAWRAYDADIPEYAAAVDIYDTAQGRRAVVQEYLPGKGVDAALAAQRLADLVAAVRDELALGEDACIVKARQRQRGASQYEKLGDGNGEELVVAEGPARLLVNLRDYLDTGLFLDHRPARRFIRANCSGKRFLNLFCYTATVTVHAALGGATESLSLDLSNTYLDWAQRNCRLNGLDTGRHQLQRADCLQWLASPRRGQWDVIFLDPPSFSNSKRMRDVLDVQRDHVDLVNNSMRLLAPGGMLLFSTNLRSFRLDAQLRQAFAVEDWQLPSLDPDFERNPRIHHCFLVRRR